MMTLVLKRMIGKNEGKFNTQSTFCKLLVLFSFWLASRFVVYGAYLLDALKEDREWMDQEKDGCVEKPIGPASAGYLDQEHWLNI